MTVLDFLDLFPGNCRIKVIHKGSYYIFEGKDDFLERLEYFATSEVTFIYGFIAKTDGDSAKSLVGVSARDDDQ